MAKKDITHGLSGTRIYRSWFSMKQRCINPNDQAYSRYGAVGITVCNRWLDFQAFYDDMQGTYKDNLTLDRIDNSKGYSPTNCRWATAKEQAINRRNTRLFTYSGKTMTLSDWSRHLRIPRSRLSMRYYKYNWPINKVLS